jgi:hypothetical protein
MLIRSLFIACFGLVITAVGSALLCLVGWSLKTRVNFYGSPMRRFKYRESPTNFIWAIIGELFFGTILLYIGIGVLLLTFK